MSNTKVHRIAFPIAKNGIPQVAIDLKKMVDSTDALTALRIRAELDELLLEIEQHGVQSICARPVSPHNDAWFIFFDVRKGTIAIYTFVDNEDTIHIYHINLQTSHEALFSLLADGKKIK
jgi:hypothetical protein